MRGDNWTFGIHIQGHPPDEQIGASFDRISPHYFETLGTRLVRGRTIGDEDTANSRQVAVVNETFVRKFFPKDDPSAGILDLGFRNRGGDFEIVGVVEDTKYQDAREPAYPTFFMPFLQDGRKIRRLAFTDRFAIRRRHRTARRRQAARTCKPRCGRPWRTSIPT